MFPIFKLWNEVSSRTLVGGDANRAVDLEGNRLALSADLISRATSLAVVAVGLDIAATPEISLTINELGRISHYESY